MTPHPFDPDAGFRLLHQQERLAIAEMANEILLQGSLTTWGHSGGGSSMEIAYVYRRIEAAPTADGSHAPVQVWESNHALSLGSIPLSKESQGTFADRFRRSLEDAFGTAAQTRLRAVLTLARLRQDTMGWAGADLVVNEQNPRGMLRTQSGQQKMSTILLKADRKRQPPDLDAFLGAACYLRLATSRHERTTIARRPDRAAPKMGSGHARMGTAIALIDTFAQHGIDLAPWHADLIA